MNSDAPRLTDADARVIDVLLEEGLDPDELPAQLASMSPDDRSRAEAALRLLGRLDRLEAPAPSPELVPALMARLDRAEREQRKRMRLDSTPRRWRRLRLPDLATIAAVVILGIGVGWPLAQSVRSASMREQCGRNMGSLHAGLSGFAGDHGGLLPMTAGFGAFVQPAQPGTAPATRVDWQNYRHGENLELLHTLDYVGSRCLTCPGCEKDRGAMSLRVPAAGQRFAMGVVQGMLVADANSAIDLLREGRPCGPGISVSSTNHRQQGQNVLFDDGSVRWLLSPVLVNGDSIWAPRDERDPAGALEQGLLPADPRDVFLAQ